ncbi:MAG: carboxypeptidase regulatory-like domain-containing protein [Deltaproteobacteria bacterium]|nr:carboxypeptidase regulatory-like domain-containing protein [Deltaproteobacteria bacterium]
MIGFWCAIGFAGGAPAYGATTSLRTVEGVVKFSRPISHATIRLLDASGRILVEQTGATNEDGYFSLSVPGRVPAVQVQATGGASGAEPFEGTLYGTLESESGNPEKTFIHLNVGTTLTALYRKHEPKASLEQAEARVHRFLELPELISVETGIENPYLTGFSAETLGLEAAEAGGSLDAYFDRLSGEMSRDADATTRFPAALSHKLHVGPAMWIGEKLLSGIVGNVGSQMFDKLMKGIGFPSTEDKIYGMMTQVIAQLAEIKSRLGDIEIAIKKVDYNIRSSALRKVYGEYANVVDKLGELGVKAKANTGPDGKAKDPVKTKEIAEAASKYMKQLTDKDMDLITHVHAELTTAGDNDPLQQVFAEVKWGQAPVINAQYFKDTKDQVDQYRAYQAIVTALLVDALRAHNPTDADVVLQTALKKIESEKPIYPTHKLFASSHLASIKEGKQFYAKSTNLIWDTKYMHFDRCADLNQNRANPGDGFRSPHYDEITNMMVDQKINGEIFGSAMKKIGFSAADADAIKIITFGCQTKGSGKRKTTYFNWFGNDQKGPWSQYYDPNSQFSKVRAQKGMGNGIWSLKVKTLK